MKTKLQILVLLMLFSCLAVPPVSVTAQTADPIGTPAAKELPSISYLKKEKRSIATTTNSAPLAAPYQGLYAPRSTSWEDPFLPGDGEWSNPGNVGAPIGDASLPIVLSLLIIYLVYRGVSTNKKRSNF